VGFAAAEGVVPADTVIEAEPVTSGEGYTTVRNALQGVSTNFVLFDIKLFSESSGGAVQPNGSVSVSVPRESLAGINLNSARLYHISADGTLSSPISFVVEGDNVVFSANTFSWYAFAEVTGAGSGIGSDGNPQTGVMIAVVPMLIAGLAGGTAWVVRKRR
jgi:hypothetical protein